MYFMLLIATKWPKMVSCNYMRSVCPCMSLCNDMIYYIDINIKYSVISMFRQYCNHLLYKHHLFDLVYVLCK